MIRNQQKKLGNNIRANTWMILFYLFLVNCNDSIKPNPCIGDIESFSEKIVNEDIDIISVKEIKIPKMYKGEEVSCNHSLDSPPRNNSTCFDAGDFIVTISGSDKFKYIEIKKNLTNNDLNIKIKADESDEVYFLGVSKDKAFYFTVRHSSMCNKFYIRDEFSKTKIIASEF